MAETLIVKVGGSVLTDKKSEVLSIRFDVLKRVARELAEVLSNNYRLIILHGAGSAGHPPVKKYGLHLGYKSPDQLIGYAIAQNRVNKLRQALLEALEEQGVPAIEFYPSSMIVQDKGRIVEAFLEPIKRLFELGVTPVLSGDLVADRSMGFSVCSGDQLAFLFAEEFNASKIIFGVDVDGLYTADPTKSSAELIREVKYSELKNLLGVAGESAGIDVTRGMKGKLTEALLHPEFFKRGGEVWILNMVKENTLLKALRGEHRDFTRITSD